MKFILIFFLFFSSLLTAFAVAEIKECETIQDEIKKKNCLIENKAKKLKKKN